MHKLRSLTVFCSTFSWKFVVHWYLGFNKRLQIVTKVQSRLMISKFKIIGTWYLKFRTWITVKIQNFKIRSINCNFMVRINRILQSLQIDRIHNIHVHCKIQSTFFTEGLEISWSWTLKLLTISSRSAKSNISSSSEGQPWICFIHQS